MSGFLEYLSVNRSHIIELTIGHAVATGFSVLIAIALGVGLGILLYRTDRPANAALAAASTMLTIPSFALFPLLIPLLGLGYPPTVVGLVFYSLLPIMRNTIVGLRSVDPAVLESAQGMGMSARQRFARIELPLAWPVIITGIRVATMLAIGILAIAAVVSGPGLGSDFFSGIARVGSAVALYLVVSAMIAIMLLALAFDAFYALVAKLTTPKGIR